MSKTRKIMKDYPSAPIAVISMLIAFGFGLGFGFPPFISVYIIRATAFFCLIIVLADLYVSYSD